MVSSGLSWASMGPNVAREPSNLLLARPRSEELFFMS